jgi:hypothetical protein
MAAEGLTRRNREPRCMKLQNFLTEEELNPEPKQAAEFILWVPPTGSAVECPSLELAQLAAEKYAARHPGTTVWLYSAIGFAFKAPDDNVELVRREPRALTDIKTNTDGSAQ